MISPAIVDRWYELVPKTTDDDVVDDFVSKIASNKQDLKSLKEFVEHMFYETHLRECWMNKIEEYETSSN